MSKIKYHAYNLAAELHVANRDKGSFSGGSSSLVHVPLNAQGYIHTCSVQTSNANSLQVLST